MSNPLSVGDLPGRVLRRLARHPTLVVGAATLGVRVGRDAGALRRGEIDPPEFRRRAGAHVGHIGGGIAGATAGAAAGSVVPVLGTLLGAFAGGMLGEHLGGRLGRAAVDAAETRWREDGDGAGAPGGGRRRRHM
jgi:phage tail tape-measure protein